MKRVVVGRYGGPEVLQVVEEDDPRPGPGEVRVRVLAAGVSFSDALLRAGTYLGGPKPPFTPGYELVGVVEELGPGCSRLREGDRVAVLTVWGADAERVCVPERYAVEVPEDLDPAEVVSLVLPYMTAYQLLHRVARVKSGETVLVHGAAGRVGTAVLELGALAGLRLYGTASARDRAAVERLGAVAIDYRNEDFLARVREPPRERRRRCARRARWRDVGSFVSRAAARWKAGRVRLLLRAHAGAQEPASVDQVERADRERLSLGPALAPPAGPRLPDRQAAQPPPGVVPGGLPRATRTASPRRDPPDRGRAPTAHRSAPRARTAGELGGHGKARARAITRTACGVSRRRAIRRDCDRKHYI